MLHLVVELARDAPQQLAHKKTTRISKLHTRSLPQTTHPTRAPRPESSVGSQPRAILRTGATLDPADHRAIVARALEWAAN